MEFLSSWQTNKQGKNKPQNSGIFVFCVLCCCVLIICLCKLGWWPWRGSASFFSGQNLKQTTTKIDGDYLSDINNIFHAAVVVVVSFHIFEEENSFNAEQEEEEEEGLYLKFVEREKISRESLSMENEKNFKEMCIYSYVYIYTQGGEKEEEEKVRRYKIRRRVTLDEIPDSVIILPKVLFSGKKKYFLIFSSTLCVSNLKDKSDVLVLFYSFLKIHSTFCLGIKYISKWNLI